MRRGVASRLTRAALALAALGLAVPALAQQARLEPSAAIDCLSPAAAERGAPDYPFVEFKDGTAGRVKVVLSFTSPGTRPSVKVLEQEGGPAFVKAVEAHARSLRVPCHDGGDLPVQLLFDYVFRKDDRQVYPSPPLDADSAARAAQLACMVHQSGDKAPPYPPAALRAQLQGRVLTRLRFEAADQPPVAEIYTYASGESNSRQQREMAMLSDPVQKWVAGYRMPCHQGRPITTSIVFVYRMEGDAFGFKPEMSLLPLLSLVRGIRQQRLVFDTHTMACPFDVDLLYRRPHLPNGVNEVGSTDPTRRPLLDWLQQIELDLPPQSLASVYADSTRFTVPCIKLNLKPAS